MGIFKKARWQPVFASESEAEARVIAGFLQGHDMKVKLLGDPSSGYEKQPFIKGIAGRWGRYIVFVHDSETGRAEDLIKDYLEDNPGDLNKT